MLTQAEIDALHERTIVRVTWEGGNGPNHYYVRKRAGLSFASQLMVDDFPGTSRLDVASIKEIEIVGLPTTFDSETPA